MRREWRVSLVCIRWTDFQESCFSESRRNRNTRWKILRRSFAEANLGNRKAAFLLPIAAMFLSDLVLGFAVYGTTLLKSQPAVYLCILITVGIGRLIQNKRSVLKIAAATFS